MALQSMTGYGQGHAASRDLDVDVHLSSVNRKQFDARISLPRSLLALESRVVKTIRSHVRRGQVTGTVRLHATEKARRRGVVVDAALAKVYIRALQKTGGNREEAAKMLHIGVATLIRKLKKYELK